MGGKRGQEGDSDAWGGALKAPSNTEVNVCFYFQKLPL